jgi:hypothetical protein
MAQDEKKLIRIAKRLHADLGALDSLVMDAKCIQANKINNRGVETQIKYLFKQFGYTIVKRWMISEVKAIRKHNSSKGMVQPKKIEESKEDAICTRKRIKKQYPQFFKRK